jgi:molybdopterin-guanine dinucleotide biosynthesis protein A
MGRDKAAIEIDGVPMAVRVARALTEVAYPVLVVGPSGDTRLDSIDDPHEGPLYAFVAGGAALRARGHGAPVLLLACDLPFVTAPLLSLLVRSLGDTDVALPVLDGREQPLCAVYAQNAIDVAARVVALGMRSMRELVATLNVRRISEREWSAVAARRALQDVDTPDELKRILDDPA